MNTTNFIPIYCYGCQMGVLVSGSVMVRHSGFVFHPQSLVDNLGKMVYCISCLDAKNIFCSFCTRDKSEYRELYIYHICKKFTCTVCTRWFSKAVRLSETEPARYILNACIQDHEKVEFMMLLRNDNKRVIHV